MKIEEIIVQAHNSGQLIEPIEAYTVIKKNNHHKIYSSSSQAIELKITGNIGKGNSILCGEKCIISRENITIKGNNNTIILGGYSQLNGASIKIFGDNNLFYFGAFSTVGSMIVMLKGTNNSISIGDFCMLSNRIIIENSDHHSIYNLNTGLRINNNKNVKIGDKVWIGRDVKISKGVTIGSNIVIGQGSIVTKNLVDNNCYAGIPARLIQENIAWSRMESESLDEMESSERNQMFLTKVNNFQKKIIDFNKITKKKSKYKYDKYISLGYNCEVGLQLRRWGYEESSFFRFTYCNSSSLIKILDNNFNNIFQYENLIPSNEKMVKDTSYNISFHTKMTSSRINNKRVFDHTNTEKLDIYNIEQKKVKYLIQKMFEEIKSNKYILFFLKTEKLLECADIEYIIKSLEDFGFNNFNLVYITLEAWNISCKNKKIFIEKVTNYTAPGQKGIDADIDGYDFIFQKYNVPKV